MPSFSSLIPALLLALPALSAPLARRQTAPNPKLVVAHHIVGNTFPYTQDTWAADIALASANGIDGFALNVGQDPFTQVQVNNAYAAAQATPNFKMFLSLDMSSLPCATADDGAALRTLVTSVMGQQSQLLFGSPPRAFVSTFAGESCTFGAGSVAEGWASQFTRHPDLSGANAIYFAPAFFMDPATFPQFGDVMDGDFNFNSGWPIQVTTADADGLLSSNGTSLTSFVNGVSAPVEDTLSKFVGATDTDDQHRAALAQMPTPVDQSGTRAYMAAVAPWFFTHFGADSFNKNFIFLADDHLYATRWENLIATRDQVDLVEVVTWNDYGESHYIGPIEGSLPTGSEAWTNGFNHTGWLAMTNYFATAFKTGTPPPITQDQLFLWARPHTGDATGNDPVGKPTNFELSQDIMWAVVMASAPGTVTLDTSADGSGVQSFDVPAGVTKLSVPLTVGGGMHGTVVRDGQTTVDLKPAFTFQDNVQAFNFNAFVASNVDV